MCVYTYIHTYIHIMHYVIHVLATSNDFIDSLGNLRLSTWQWELMLGVPPVLGKGGIQESETQTRRPGGTMFWSQLFAWDTGWSNARSCMVRLGDGCYANNERRIELCYMIQESRVQGLRSKVAASKPKVQESRRLEI